MPFRGKSIGKDKQTIQKWEGGRENLLPDKRIGISGTFCRVGKGSRSAGNGQIQRLPDGKRIGIGDLIVIDNGSCTDPVGISDRIYGITGCNHIDHKALRRLLSYSMQKTGQRRLSWKKQLFGQRNSFGNTPVDLPSKYNRNGNCQIKS